jgi:hypothetical protein
MIIVSMRCECKSIIIMIKMRIILIIEYINKYQEIVVLSLIKLDFVLVQSIYDDTGYVCDHRDSMIVKKTDYNILELRYLIMRSVFFGLYVWKYSYSISAVNSKVKDLYVYIYLLYMYIYIYKYIRIHVYIHLHIYMHINTCIFTHRHKYVYLYICPFFHIYMYINTYLNKVAKINLSSRSVRFFIYTHMRINIYTCTHKNTYIYICIYIYMYIHICIYMYT